MICPKCKNENKKSRVYCYGSFSTLMFSRPFYDEGGIYHHHDGNTYTDTYQCSEGHKIIVTSKGKCESCDWGHDTEIVSVEDMKVNINYHANKDMINNSND